MSVGYSGVIPHDSFFGFFNMFRRVDQRYLIKQGERPPYPIIIDDPTAGQVLSNLNRADLGLVITAGVLGLFLSRIGARSAVGEFQRQQMIKLQQQAFITFGALMGFMNSQMRLKGFTENGLRWRRRNDELRKYDFTRDYEDQTIWKHFRIRDL